MIRGNLTVDSAPGRGTVVTVRAPLDDDGNWPALLLAEALP